MSATVTYNCREIVELVTEYLEGALPARERLGFERHVAICPPCRGYLAQLRRIVESAPALGAEELPAELQERLELAFVTWKSERQP